VLKDPIGSWGLVTRQGSGFFGAKMNKENAGGRERELRGEGIEEAAHFGGELRVAWALFLGWAEGENREKPDLTKKSLAKTGGGSRIGTVVLSK